MKKVIMGIVLALIFIIIAIIVMFIVVSSNSKKLVCESKEGKITLMYNKNTISGYTAKDIVYNMDQQKQLAEQIGIDKYLEDFTNWFEKNTTGTCKIK